MGFKMKNARGFIILKIIINASPSIKCTIFGTDNRLEKRGTYRTINPCANNIIKPLSFEVFSNRRFGGVIEKNMIFYKIGSIM